jgi:hypothetical protein
MPALDIGFPLSSLSSFLLPSLIHRLTYYYLQDESTPLRTRPSLRVRACSSGGGHREEIDGGNEARIKVRSGGRESASAVCEAVCQGLALVFLERYHRLARCSIIFICTTVAGVCILSALKYIFGALKLIIY